MKRLLGLGGVLVALLGAIWASLWLGLDGDARLNDFVLIQLRLPRLLIGLMAGATLASVGAAYQVLFQNALANESTLGTTAGAALGALAALVLGASSHWFLPAATLAAFVGGALTTALVCGVAWSGRARLQEVLLAGIAVTLASGALSQGLQSLADADALLRSAQWSLGQLPQIGFDRVGLALLPCAMGSGLLLLRSRALGTLALGEDWARSVGVETRRLRVEVLVASSLGVGAVVALCGPIAFVGLLVPHLVRRFVSNDPRRLLPLSLVAGAAYLVWCDVLSRSLVPGRELPVGVLTAALGAPALFFLVLWPRAKG